MASSDTAIVAIVFLVLWFTTMLWFTTVLLVCGSYYVQICAKPNTSLNEANGLINTETLFDIRRSIRKLGDYIFATCVAPNVIRDTPTAPATPTAPVTPTAHVIPTAHVTPTAPTAPAAPATPAAPVSPIIHSRPVQCGIVSY